MLAAIPWRFLSGLACGAFVVWLWHDASVSRIELRQVQEKAQAVIEQSIVVTQADAKASKELSDAKAKTEVLAGELASGAKRLRIAATCLPVANGSGMDANKGAVLDRTAESSYLALRRNLEVKEAQIKGLQDIVRGLSGSAQK
ncbi:Bacteriophage lysis protein [compost metagenome]